MKRSLLVINFLIILSVTAGAQKEYDTFTDLLHEILVSGKDFNNLEDPSIVIFSDNEKITTESILSKYPDTKHYIED